MLPYLAWKSWSACKFKPIFFTPIQIKLGYLSHNHINLLMILLQFLKYQNQNIKSNNILLVSERENNYFKGMKYKNPNYLLVLSEIHIDIVKKI